MQIWKLYFSCVNGEVVLNDLSASKINRTSFINQGFDLTYLLIFKRKEEVLKITIPIPYDSMTVEIRFGHMYYLTLHM